MPRYMSFALTTQQIRDSAKSVTRRLGWADLQPGELLWAVEKAQGLKKGEKVKRIRMIRVQSVRREHLDALLPGRRYSMHPSDAWIEVCREGFPDMTPAGFVAMFCKANKCAADVMVNRIEFGYVELEKVPGGILSGANKAAPAGYRGLTETPKQEVRRLA